MKFECKYLSPLSTCKTMHLTCDSENGVVILSRSDARSCSQYSIDRKMLPKFLLQNFGIKKKCTLTIQTFPDSDQRPLPSIGQYFHVNTSLRCEFHVVPTPADHLSPGPFGLFLKPQFRYLMCPWHGLQTKNMEIKTISKKVVVLKSTVTFRPLR